jgi:hypothetical protein
VAKGLECVYDGRKPIFETPKEGCTLAPASAASFIDRDLSNDIFAWDDTQIDVDPDTLGLLVADVHSHDLTCSPSRPWESVFSEDFDSSLLFDSMDIAARSDNQFLETVPRFAHTTRDSSFPAASAPASLTSQPNSAFMARLRMSDPVSQHSATLVVQTLRAFPQMMLRRQTFPPFIHPHWHRPSTATRTAVPKPLANCMSVAHLFASLTSEIKPFLWRTIRAEQRRFIDEVGPLFLLKIFSLSSYSCETYLLGRQKIHRFEKEELLAAIQAHMIYLIMRFVEEEDAPQHAESDLQMLVPFQVRCSPFIAF